MHNKVNTDIAIVGGGIAGLWLLNRLRQKNYSVILLESATLGGGQTHKAQGIIHGGMKYALQGSLTSSSQAIADMPMVWGLCLQGKGEIDLSQVPILSSHQYLFSTGKIAGKLAGFFSNIALQGRVEELARDRYPLIFQHAKFKGLVYSLDEMAIDVHTLVQELVKPNKDCIFKVEDLYLHFDAKEHLDYLEVKAANGDVAQIHAQKYIFTAGIGNELLAQKLTPEKVPTQRRPLHMVVVKTDFTYPVFAHCFGIGSTPRITITTHQAQDGKTIWYLGGQIAEEGMKRNTQEQTQFAKQELEDVFPWLDFSKASFASFFVDRAEPQQAGGKRPDYACMKEIGNIIVAWPTKLALAPCLANDIISSLQIQPGNSDKSGLKNFPLPDLARPIWDDLL